MQNTIESDPRSYEATKKHLQKKLRKREWEGERERGRGGIWFMVHGLFQDGKNDWSLKFSYIVYTTDKFRL